MHGGSYFKHECTLLDTFLEDNDCRITQTVSPGCRTMQRQINGGRGCKWKKEVIILCAFCTEPFFCWVQVQKIMCLNLFPLKTLLTIVSAVLACVCGFNYFHVRNRVVGQTWFSLVKENSNEWSVLCSSFGHVFFLCEGFFFRLNETRNA